MPDQPEISPRVEKYARAICLAEAPGQNPDAIWPMVGKDGKPRWQWHIKAAMAAIIIADEESGRSSAA